MIVLFFHMFQLMHRSDDGLKVDRN